MKISPELATFVASNRYKYLTELALYLDKPVHESINEVVSFYQNDGITGVIIPTQFQPLTSKKVEKIASGKHECRAYLAQTALDICLKEGYLPSSDFDKKLFICMLLTRSIIKSPDEIFKLMPSWWNTDYLNNLNTLMLDMVNV
jgi:hypothetical protein